jgi:hypothetical protein
MSKIFKHLFGVLLSTILIIIVVFFLLFCLITLDLLFESYKAITSGANIQIWLVSTFEINPNTATSIIASFSIFLAGLLTTWTTHFVVKLRERYRYRKILSNYAKTLSFALVRKSRQFKECAETMDVRIKENFSLSDMALTHLDNIQKIEITRFDSAFFEGIENFGRTNKDNKAFDNIYTVISNVKRVEELYVNQFEKFITRYNYLEERRNEAIMKVKEIIDNLQDDAFGKNVPNDIPHEYYQYLIGISQIIAEWNVIENNLLPSIFDEHFIQKLRQHNHAFNDSIRVRKYLPNSLYYSLNDADNEYKSMKILIETNHKIFMNYSSSYKRQSRKIFDSINRINQYPILTKFV